MIRKTKSTQPTNGADKMATFAQALEAATKLLQDKAVASVSIEFLSVAGLAMTATITRDGLKDVKIK